MVDWFSLGSGFHKNPKNPARGVGDSTGRPTYPAALFFGVRYGQ